jgi:hypothetical protein
MDQNYIGKVNEFYQKHDKKTISFVDDTSFGTDSFCMTVVTPDKKTFVGTGPTKKIAKQNACKKCWEQLQKHKRVELKIDENIFCGFGLTYAAAILDAVEKFNHFSDNQS